MKKNNKNPADQIKIVDGRPNNAPFDLPAKKKEEIKNKIEKLYGDVLKKKSENK